MSGTWSNQRVDLILLQEDISGFSGIFGYSPSIGAGNLVFSLSASGGTDPYGNVYPAGLNADLAPGVVTAGTIAAGALDGLTMNSVTINNSTISGSNLICTQNAGGLFVYSSGGGQVVQTFQTSGTWVAPTGVTSVLAECWGAGGGGAAGFSEAGGGVAGGGGGEYAAESALVVTAGHSYSYTVGSGGNAGVGQGNLGTNGSNSTFAGDAKTVTAHGGKASTDSVTGGTGGTGSSNATHHNGGAGGNNFNLTVSGFTAGAGGGGSGGPSSAGNKGSSTSGSGASPGGTAVADGGAGGQGGHFNVAGSGGGIPGGGAGGGWGSGSGFSNGGQGAIGQARVTYTASGNTLLVSIVGAATTDPVGGASVPAGVMINSAVAPLVAEDPVNGGAETWHSLGSLSNFTVNRGRYRLEEHGYLELDIDLTSAGSNAGSTDFSATLPSAYRPAITRHMPLSQSVVQNTGSNWPALNVSSGGTVTTIVRSNTAATYGNHCTIPLD